MEDKDKLNLYDVPLLALRDATRQIIVCGLQKEKILPSPDKLPRDWRGLAHLAGLPSPAGDNPVSQLLIKWEQKGTATLGHLEEFLGKLDRWDIVDDVYHLIREDAAEFFKRNSGSSINRIEADVALDQQILTFGDIARLQHGLELQMFDALLLYADEDRTFAYEMVRRLEQAGCKLCLKDHLVAGLSFEHQGVMRLISERCRHVIIIVSRNFIGSNANRFFVLFAQAMSIERDRRIIIPCIYGEGPIQMPIEIKHIFKLDFNRTSLSNYDFWGQLQASVSNPMLRSPLKLTQSAWTIHELSSKTLKIKELPNTSWTTDSMTSVVDHKRSSSQLSVSMHSSEDSTSATCVKDKRHKLKAKAFFKNILRSNKQPKKQKAIPVAV